MDKCKKKFFKRKVDEWEVRCEEEEDAERERKLVIRQAEGTGDEQIRRGSTGSKGKVERARHERGKRERRLFC